MTIVKLFVGLDYHQDQVQVCVLDQDGKVLGNRRLENNTQRIVAWVERLGQVQAAALEACCGAANLGQELRDAGWNVSLAHPGIAARMKQNPDKTDLSDARLLADLLRVGYLPKVWLASEQLRRLRRLVRHRQELVDQRRNVKLRIRALLRENRVKPDKGIHPWTKAFLAWLADKAPLEEDDRWLMNQHLLALAELSSQIMQVEKRLEERTADDAVVQKLQTFDSVGLVTAVTMRAEIGEFDRFKNGKQLSRYCGLTPWNVSSGQRQADAGLIAAGNPQLRRVLVELSHRLVHRMDDRWSKLAARMLAQGKKKNVVIAAVANRWVRWLHHQMQPLELAV